MFVMGPDSEGEPGDKVNDAQKADAKRTKTESSIDEEVIVFTDFPDTAWVKFSTEDGRSAYQDKVSGETRWRLPLIFENWKTSEYSKYNKTIKKSEWKRLWSEENRGRAYYASTTTRQSVYTTPPELQDFERRIDEYIHEKLFKKSSRDPKPQAISSDATGPVSTVEVAVIEAVSSEAALPTTAPAAAASPAMPFEEEKGVGQVDELVTSAGATSTAEVAVTEAVSSETTTITAAATAPNASLEEEKELLDKLITSPDAIFEGNVAKTIACLTQKHMIPGSTIFDKLCEGYVGQPHMIHVVAEWLTLVDNIDDAVLSSSAVISTDPKEAEKQCKDIRDRNEKFRSRHVSAVEETLMSELADLVKEKFNKTDADEMVGSSKDVPKFLKDMIEDVTWRRLLIELFDSNRESVVLRWCLRQISYKGCHREIAKVVREADFDVSNDLLVSMLVSTLSANAADLEGIVDDLRRMCYHSDYMFLYAHELLLAVERSVAGPQENETPQTAIAENDFMDVQSGNSVDNGVGDGSKKRKTLHSLNGPDGWACKVRRLRQELDEAAIWRSGAQGVTDASEMSHALDSGAAFALRCTQLYDPVLDSSALLNSFLREVVDFLKSGAIDSVHIQRIYSILVG